MPVIHKSKLMSLFPPDETTISNPPALALKTSFKSSKYLFFPFTSIKNKSSITSVKSLTLLLLGSSARVIFASGNSFFKEINAGKKNISSPIPPKFIASILLILFMI